MRNSVCKFIAKVGQHTSNPCKPLSVNTAKVYLHRVCMSQSVAKGRQNPKLLGVTCLFVACKTEEDMHPVRELIWAMNKIDVDEKGKNLYPYGTTARTVDERGRKLSEWMVEEESAEFQKVRENILQVERLILQVLDYDFHVRHPLTHMKDMIQFLDMRRKKNADNTDFEETRRLVEGDGSVLSEIGTKVHQMAIAMANDSGSTTLALQYDAAVIAAGCVSLAIKASTKSKPFKLIKLAKWCKELVVHLQSKHDPHLHHVSLSLVKEHIEDVTNQMLDLYDEAEQQATSSAAPPVPEAADGNNKPTSSAAPPHTALEPPQKPPRAPQPHLAHPAQKASGHASAAPAGPTQQAADRKAQDLADLDAGKIVRMEGSGPKPYELHYKQETNIYLCTCTVWRNVSCRDRDKTCRHLIKVRGLDTETGRVGEEGIAKMEQTEVSLRQKQAASHQAPRARAEGEDGNGGAKRARVGP